MQVDFNYINDEGNNEGTQGNKEIKLRTTTDNIHGRTTTNNEHMKQGYIYSSKEDTPKSRLINGINYKELQRWHQEQEVTKS